MATQPSATLPAASPVEGVQAGPDLKAAPMPVSAFQEAEIQKIFHKRVRNKCGDEIKGLWHNTPFHCKVEGLEASDLLPVTAF